MRDEAGKDMGKCEMRFGYMASLAWKGRHIPRG